MKRSIKEFFSEKTALFGRAPVARAEKVRGDFDGVCKGEELVPGIGFGGEDDIAGIMVFADENFGRRKTEVGRQTHRLAAAVFEKFCDFAHDGPLWRLWSSPPDIYHDISQRRWEQPVR